MLSINLVDTVYSRYTGRRTTWTFFSEFANEGNLGNIFFIELLHHWYLLLIGILFLIVLILFYRPVKPIAKPAAHYITHSLATLLFLPLSVIGMRGGASTAILSSMLAIENKTVTSVEGIIADDVDQCILNMNAIGTKSMSHTDELVLDMMTHK